MSKIGHNKPPRKINYKSISINKWVYEELDIRTDDIYWSMEQYQRNRQPFDWEIKFEYSNL